MRPISTAPSCRQGVDDGGVTAGRGKVQRRVPELIGVGRIGASLQHRDHTARGSVLCITKQERVLVLVRDVGHLGACCQQALERACVLCEL